VKRYFGSIRQLASGRYQARYTGPDGRPYTAQTPQGRPLTFGTKQDAGGWLALRQSEILRGAWLPPAAPKAAPVTLRPYAATWLAGRDLADRTREDYAQVLRDHILPAFGDAPVTAITPAAVREWHVKLRDATGPTMRARAYGLLRTILNTAVADEVIPASPCRVRGGGSVKRAGMTQSATLAELETIVTAMPARYRLMVLLAAWCALRFGELAELRRADIDVTNGIIRIRRGVVRIRGGRKVKDPKSDAGKRDVAIPPHLMPAVRDHLREHVPVRRDALMFPAASGGHMAPATLYRVYYPARNAAGRPDLRFHDLRHTGATLAAATGATLKELMARLGHSTVAAALLYQHAAAERDKVIAAALSELAGDATVTPITRAKSKKRKEVTA
jgi:integrase